MFSVLCCIFTQEDGYIFIKPTTTIKIKGGKQSKRILYRARRLGPPHNNTNIALKNE